MTIRRTPSDFRVDERLADAISSSLRTEAARDHPVALYRLTKQSLTTPEGVQRLAKALGVRPGDVQPAGLKDKHALTTQHVSVLVRDGAAAARMPPEIAAAGWSATRLGWIAEHLSSAAIDRNHFEIVVRDLSEQASREMERRATMLHADGCMIFVNYFGDQRFGSARHGQGFVATHLIRAEFDAALRLAIATPARKDTGAKRTFTRVAAQRWPDFSGMLPNLPRCPERRAIEHLAQHPGQFREAFATLPMFFQQMCVEAFQSHLWNACARLLAEQIASECGSDEKPTPERPRVRPAQKLLRTPDDFGEMLFPLARCVSDAWQSVVVPLLAPDSKPSESVTACVDRVLAAEGIALTDLRIPGLRRPYFGDAPRPLFAVAEHFSLSDPEQDELSKGGKRLRRTVMFDLPRGSYATVLLRALGQ